MKPRPLAPQWGPDMDEPGDLGDVFDMYQDGLVPYEDLPPFERALVDEIEMRGPSRRPPPSGR